MEEIFPENGNMAAIHLENMGYTVHRVKNEEIRDKPNDIAEV